MTGPTVQGVGIFDRFFDRARRGGDQAPAAPNTHVPDTHAPDVAGPDVTGPDGHDGDRLVPARPGPGTDPWDYRQVEPVRRVPCTCVEHVEDLLAMRVPYTEEMAAELEEPMTVGELIECGALDARPHDPADRWLSGLEGDAPEGPFGWMVWLGDEARAHYDDDADLPLDRALLDQPGLERVAWEDREVFHVGADGLCRSGVLAAAARALADPRVRLP